MTVFSQNAKIDSLLIIVETSKEEDKIDLYIDIAREYYYTSYHEYIAYSQKAKELAIKYDLPDKLLYANNSIAIGYNQMGVFDSAMVYYQKVYDYVVEVQDSQRIAIIHRNIGIVYHTQGRMEKAKNWYFQSLEIGKSIKDTTTIVRALSSLVSLYSDMGDYVESIKVALEALTIAELNGSQKMQADILTNLGVLYGEMEDYDKSLKYHVLSLDLSVKEGNNRGISHALGNIGLVYKKIGNIDSAKVYFQKSLEIKRQMSNRLGIATSLDNLGSLYKEEGKYEKALACFNEALLITDSADLVLQKVVLLRDKASVLVEKGEFERAKQIFFECLEIAKQEGLMADIRDNYEGIAKLYEKKGDLVNTVKYLKLHSEIKDSILNESNQRAITEMQTRYESEKKEQEIQLLTKEHEIKNLKIRKQSTQLYFLLVFIILAGIVLYLVFIRYRLKQKQKQSDLEMKSLETEQRMLRSQMNPHFIFNSMNSIQSFISGKDNLTAMSYLSKFARLMRFILENSRKSMISLEDEVETLQLYIELEKIRFKHKFDFSLDIDPAITPETIFVPPMLVQPMVENAIKHGLRNKEGKGLLELSFEKINDKIKCTVRDNGIGRAKANKLNENIQKDHNSLGMQVTLERIETLNQKMNDSAGLEIIDLKDNSGKPEGTLVNITIPYEEE